MSLIRISTAVAIPLILLVAGCTQPSKAPEAASDLLDGFVLADTSWELTAITDNQTQGSTVANVETGLYTMLIRADGTAAFRLDCNRGFGTWEGEARTSPNSGSLTFSETGVTKALCPPQSISDRVAADISKFGTFRIEGEQLLLTGKLLDVTYRWIEADEPSTQKGRY